MCFIATLSTETTRHYAEVFFLFHVCLWCDLVFRLMQLKKKKKTILGKDNVLRHVSILAYKTENRRRNKDLFII